MYVITLDVLFICGDNLAAGVAQLSLVAPSGMFASLK